MRMWHVAMTCPHCPRENLRSKGLYNGLRLVLDVSTYYYLATAYHDCQLCRATFIAYDSRLLDQLSEESGEADCVQTELHLS